MSEYEAFVALASNTNNAVSDVAFGLMQNAYVVLDSRLPAVKAAIDNTNAYNQAAVAIGSAPMPVRATTVKVADAQISGIIAECESAIAELKQIQANLEAFRAEPAPMCNGRPVLTGSCTRSNGANGTIIFGWSTTLNRYDVKSRHPHDVVVIEYDRAGLPICARFWTHWSGVPVVDGVITRFA